MSFLVFGKRMDELNSDQVGLVLLAEALVGRPRRLEQVRLELRDALTQRRQLGFELAPHL